jgi:hypothetical protein
MTENRNTKYDKTVADTTSTVSAVCGCFTTGKAQEERSLRDKRF